jgi:hypothetical protein
VSARVWWRAWRIRRARKHAPTFSRDELAELIAVVRRPQGRES